MDIAIVGAGKVGTTLGRGLADAGHHIIYGVRDANAAKYDALRRGASELASVRGAVERAEAVILATPWAATQAALASAGDFAGKPLLDATNPIGADLALTHGHNDSGAEQVARWATNAQVVKVFNTTGLENMANPRYGDVRVTMFVCGDDPQANSVALGFARDLGFDPVSIGGLSKARLLEPAALLWIKLAHPLGNGRDIALSILQRQDS